MMDSNIWVVGLAMAYVVTLVLMSWAFTKVKTKLALVPGLVGLLSLGTFAAGFAPPESHRGPGWDAWGHQFTAQAASSIALNLVALLTVLLLIWKDRCAERKKLLE